MNQDLVDVLDLSVEQLAALFDGVPADSERAIYCAKGVEADALELLLDVDEDDPAIAIVGRRTMIDQLAGEIEADGQDDELLARGAFGTYRDVPVVIAINYRDFGGVERIGPDQLLVLVRSGQHRKLVDTSLTPEPPPAPAVEGQRGDEPPPLNFPTSTFTPGALGKTS